MANCYTLFTLLVFSKQENCDELTGVLKLKLDRLELKFYQFLDEICDFAGVK